MIKANAKNDVTVAQMLAFTPEELERVVAEMKAAKQRVIPGQQIWVQAAPGIFFYYDPKVLGGDLERRFQGKPVSTLLNSGEELQIGD